MTEETQRRSSLYYEIEEHYRKLFEEALRVENYESMKTLCEILLDALTCRHKQLSNFHGLCSVGIDGAKKSWRECL